MAWPQANEFQESVQNPRLAFSDPDLRSSEAKTNALGLPHAVSGQFGIVYEMKAADGRCWAVKCFTGPSSDRQRRYQAIGARLKQVNLPFMVGIDYLEQGIRIQGQWYPILKMEWVEGQTLNEFVGQRVEQPHLLEGLLDMWVKVAQRLRETDVTHADLQHGNVMLIPGIVEGKVSLRLVDYDGMYLPALAGLPSGEMGHRDFQHPKRLATSYYGPEVDRFSHLVIYTALLAVRDKGKVLWNKYSTGDNLLFTQADFANPGSSKILLDLWREGSDDLRALTGRLVLATRQSLKDVPHLSDVLANGRALSLTGEQVRDVNRNLSGEQSQQRPALPTRPIPDVPGSTRQTAVKEETTGWKRRIGNKGSPLGILTGALAFVLLVIGIIAAVRQRSPNTGEKQTETQAEKQIGPIAVKKPKAKFSAVQPISTDDKILKFDMGNNVKLDMVKINAKGKKFQMGSPKEEAGRGIDEDQHEVSFNHDFYLGKYEVTQEQYEALLGRNPAHFKGPQNPVEQVLWNDAQEFVNMLNETFKDRQVTFRLPSEAEWEFACRAGTTTPFHFGKEFNGKQANCNGRYPYGTIEYGPYLEKTKAVGGYDANAFGLHDMHGNLWEWCEDYYGPYSAAPKDGTAQMVKQVRDARVMRGGSWNEISQDCRSAYRISDSPSFRSYLVGFRVALTQQTPGMVEPSDEPKKQSGIPTADGFRARLIGTWDIVSVAGSKIDFKVILTFANDGKFLTNTDANGKEDTTEGTWNIIGDKLTTTTKGAMAEIFTVKSISVDRVTLVDNSGLEISLKRK